MTDQGSETNSEQLPIPSPTFATIEQSRINSVIPEKNIDSSVNKQIEVKHHLQNSSSNPRSSIDKEQSRTLKRKSIFP